MIERLQIYKQITTALKRSRITVLIGPRQCGKTTMARKFVKPDSINYFDLEDPIVLSVLQEPMTALRKLKGIVVIDEIQLRPNLFPILRVLVDRNPLPAKFLILGSASPELLRQSAESLAGRIEIVSMSGFSLPEIGIPCLDRHWLRGGFPLSFLAKSNEDSLVWRKDFISTFLERDLHKWGIGAAAPALRRFWSILAHYHGQIWNAAEPARNLGINESTVRRYLDILSAVFMVRQLPPWHENLKKRQVKAPKIFFRDSGLLHNLLGIGSERELLLHPKCGASWEGYVLEEILKALQPDEAYFWATHSSAELDLLLIKKGRRIGVECKRIDAPKLTPSMRIALEDLRLDHLWVIYPGERRYSLHEKVTAIPLPSLFSGRKII